MLIGTLNPKDALRFLIAVVVVTGLAIWCGNRVGFEGDDLAIIEGAVHFDLKPRDTLYRFDWQPLSYFTGRWLSKYGIAPLSLTYLPNLLGGIGLVLLAEALRHVLRTRNRTWIAYAMVLAVPELWITTLYFNPTALGLPFFCATLFLLILEMRNEHEWLWNLAVAAILYAIACSFRLDFAAASPALLLIIFCRAPSRKWLGILVFMFVSVASGLTILTSLGVSPLASVHTVREFEALPPLPASRSAVTLLLAVLPLVLISPLLLTEIMRRKWPRRPLIFWVVVAVCAVPMLYPLTSLFSGKYLVPAFCTALVGLAFLLREPLVSSARTSTETSPSNFATFNVSGIVIIVLASYALGLQIDKRTRRVVGVTWTASTFTTDDGPRSFGGYFSFVRIIRDSKNRPDFILLNHNIAGWIAKSPGDSVVVELDAYDGPNKEWGAPLVNNWTWGWPSIYLQSNGWKLEHYVLKQRISLQAPDGRRAHIITDKEAAINLPSHECIIEIGPVRAGSRGREEDLKRIAKYVSRAPCEL